MTSPNLPVPSAAPAAVSPFQSADMLSPAQLQVWTTLNVDTPEGKALVMRFMQGDDATALGDALGEVIDVEHVLAHTVNVIDDNGEEFQADRIVLIRPDGTAVSCTAAGVKRSLQLLFGLYGLPPYRPAMRVKITQKTTRRGRRTYILNPVAEVAPAAEPARSGRSRNA